MPSLGCLDNTPGGTRSLFVESEGAAVVMMQMEAENPVSEERRDVLVGEVLSPERPSPVFERLHALVRKGYVANIGTDVDTDTVVLRHLGRAPDLVLRGNGVVEGYEGRRPRHKRMVEAPARIAADGDSETLRFMKFLDGIPPASLRDRTRPWRHKYIYFPLVLIVVWGLCLAITAAFLD